MKRMRTVHRMVAMAVLGLGLSASGQPVAEAPAAAGNDVEPVAAAPAMVGWLEMQDSLRDGPPPFAWVSEADAGPSLRGVLRQLHTVARGDRYAGVVIYLDRPSLTLAQVDEITAAMRRVREAGKKVMTFAEEYDLLTYLLACEADTIILQQRGSVMVQGLGLEELYLAGLLEKVGLKADFVQVGQFKGADEPLTRHGPSENWSRNMDALLDDFYASIVKRIGEGRRMTPQQVERLFAESWTLQDREYLQRRIVDRISDRDLVDVTEIEFGEHFVWDETMGAGAGAKPPTNPLAFFSQLFQERSRRISRPTIAIVHGYGPITSGDSTFGDSFFGGESIGSRTLVRTLGEAKDNDHIQGVVLRLDSPGGSAIASEVIWQAVRELAQAKPVFVSISSLAASGGYYIACAADQIYVAPDSIVGSIGVVGGKIVAGDLYDWLGVGVHRRTRGPQGDLFNSVEPFTDEQRQMLQIAFEKTYTQFTERVAIGRGNRIPDIDRVAQGRLFSGRQAVENGLADRIGGIDRAILDLVEQLKLEPGRYEVITMPEPLTLPEFLDQLFKLQSPPVSLSAGPTSDLFRVAQQALGPQRWRAARSVLQGLMLLQREPVLTLMPAAIVVR